ncbi:MAG TPA: hypothetical protein VFN31_03060, partial [Candidatus Saccharimonadales bacterium]|nr:hypothetical protein [Candidatus Saccharimonadales bacterium]
NPNTIYPGKAIHIPYPTRPLGGPGGVVVDGGSQPVVYDLHNGSSAELANFKKPMGGNSAFSEQSRPPEESSAQQTAIGQKPKNSIFSKFKFF